MLDIRFLRENPDLVKENIKKKFQDSKLPLVDEVIALDEELRQNKKRADDLRANRNKVSKSIGALMGQKKFEEADGLILASPVYYASANGTLIALLDRLFHSSKFNKTMKVGASIAVARRGGITATHDELNKYFTISGMPIASGQYWNGYYGSYEEEVQDLEGLQQMRTLARNMIFLMKSIELGKKEFGIPEKEKFIATNFIRK